MKSNSFFALSAFLLTACPLWAELRISEICPEPANEIETSFYHGNEIFHGRGFSPILDPNGKESGWIELENTGDSPVDLADYKITCANRGKKLKLGDDDISPLCHRMVGAHERTLVYIGETYKNSKDRDGDGITVTEYDHGVMAVPVKANPKKFPLVVLAKKDGTIIDRFIIPVDLPDGGSFAPGENSSDTYVTRAILTKPTPGKANDYTGAIPYGPNAGPLYGVSFKGISPKPTDLKANPPAKLGVDYEVSMPINPIADANGNKITKVKLIYRIMVKDPNCQVIYHPDFRAIKFIEGEAEMTKTTSKDKALGDVWTGKIPGGKLTEPGKLVQWAFLITEQGSGTAWRSPSFKNPDIAYQWYGTITEPDDTQMSKTLDTLHLFAERYEVDDNCEEQIKKGNKHATHAWPINQQHDFYESKTQPGYPYGSRCSMYDSQTSIYYDNIKIDLRGHTSAGFWKKSHGLRFNKCQPWNGEDPFTHEKLEDIRKTSFIAEYCDPTAIRQALSYRFFRKTGNLTPFDYPVRVMMNGKFFQLALHSNRFTDDLLENYYGLEEKDGSIGYGYKNCGSLAPNGESCAGLTLKKTPDDGHERDQTKLADFATTFKFDYSAYPDPKDRVNLPKISQAVVRSFNLPVWINYLATACLTQEADDTLSNLCIYYDSIHTDTWMPLPYDLNLSFGQYMADLGFRKKGTLADYDPFLCHPFFSGWCVEIGRKRDSGVNRGGNYGYEAIFQNEKFRRLYLRRLRTLMDQILKARGTSQAKTPFWQDVVVPFKEAIEPEIEEDHDTWEYYKQNLHAYPNGQTAVTKEAIYVWTPIYGTEKHERPMNFQQGIDDLWNNYIEKRRQHLFVTHSTGAGSKAKGYDINLGAGIPPAQSPISQLASKISFVDLDNPDAIVIENKNNEAVDMSGWKLGGAWTNPWQFFPAKVNEPFTLPSGTVVDANDKLYIVFDRKAYIAKINPTEQVIIGNVPAPDKARSLMTLSTADGTMVIGENSGEGPTAITYPENANGKAAVNEVFQDPAMKSWLETISATTDGQSALKAFTGSAEDLRICKMVKELPVAGAEKKVSLRIEGITPNAISGTAGFTLSARLRFNGHEKTGPIDGKVVLQEFSDLTAKPSEKALTENQFPLAIPVGNAKAKFFRLVLKDK